MVSYIVDRLYNGWLYNACIMSSVELVVSLLFWSLLFSYYVLYRCSLDNMCIIVDCYITWIMVKRGGWCRVGCFPSFWSLLFSYYVLYRCSLDNMCIIVDCYIIWIMGKAGSVGLVVSLLFSYYVIPLFLLGPSNRHRDKFWGI